MSEIRSEETEMSSAAEMTALCRRIADNRASSGNWKDRVSAVARALGVNWSRAKDLYYEDARRIDSEEMDRARQVAREDAARRQARKQAREFAAVAAYLRQVDEDFHRDTIAHLEHASVCGGAVGGPVAGPEED